MFVRLAGKIQIKAMSDSGAMPKIFKSIQYGINTPSGCELAIHRIQQQIDKSVVLESQSFDYSNPHVTLLIDISNAFNTVSRSHTINSVLSNPHASSIHRISHWSLSSSSPLLIYSTKNNNNTIAHHPDHHCKNRQFDS